jgi:hypothetical protein
MEIAGIDVLLPQDRSASGHGLSLGADPHIFAARILARCRDTVKR